MKDLPRRTLTAGIYAAVVLVAAAAPPLVFWVVLGVVGALGLAELLRLRTGWSSLWFGALFLVGLGSLGALRALGPLSARHGAAGDLPVWLFLAILPTWSADVAAYVVGSAVGRRRIAPRISPGKTWEGTIGGFVASTAIALGVAVLFGLPRFPAAIAAIGIGPIGLAGDLFESYVKRRAGVKNSGTILPGHGGILDRLDSLVAAAVFVLIVLVAFGVSQLGSEGGMFDRF